MIQFLKNIRTDERADERTDGRTDRPFFIGPFRLTPGGPIMFKLSKQVFIALLSFTESLARIANVPNFTSCI